MGKARDYIPALRFHNKIYPEDIATPLTFGDYWYVDGMNGSDADGNGKSVDKPYDTIQAAIDAASMQDIIFVRAKDWTIGQTDPNNYDETLTIAMAKSGLQIIGVGTGRVQGGLPQVKINTGSTAMLTINAPSCRIANMGFNGINSTGGGILLNDDAGATMTSFGTTIENCHFKNCVGSTATEAITGGAIMWSANGGGWQTRIAGNRFYKNVGDVVLKGTSSSVPQDVIIEGNVFSGPAANVNCNLFLKGGGSGMNGVIIDNNVFGQLPALGGAVDRYIDATGCVGMLTRNMFGCNTCETATIITFKADGTGALIPTTMHMAGNYGQSKTAGKTAEVNIA